MSKVIKYANCICIREHKKYELGKTYSLEVNDNPKIRYAVLYSKPGDLYRRVVNFDEAMFKKVFEEVSYRRERLIDEILK
jgi:hypothetical protein